MNVLKFFAVSDAAPVYAGISAWVVELLVAGLILYGLRREEKKVIARRATNKSDD